MPEVALSSHEYTFTFTFFGADQGAFPASTANTPLTQKLDSVSFDGGETLVDFSCKQDREELYRKIKSGATITGTIILKAPSDFMRKYDTEGPLVRIVGTGQNALNTGSNDQVWTFDMIMARPSVDDFIGNPGRISFECKEYGVAPALTQVATS